MLPSNGKLLDLLGLHCTAVMATDPRGFHQISEARKGNIKFEDEWREKEKKRKFQSERSKLRLKNTLGRSHVYPIRVNASETRSRKY